MWGMSQTVQSPEKLILTMHSWPGILIFGSVVLMATTIPGSETAWANTDTFKRGEYIFRVAGCRGCHTTDADRKQKTFLAGGRSLKTPFGTYFTPNITPDKKYGIGRWTQEDFKQALRSGKNPDGANYFPVFPYVSYTNMSDQDISDLWTYMKTLPPIARPNKKHQAGIVFGSRFMVGAWKLINFNIGPLKLDSSKSELWNRGYYLTEALGHCGECHTPRDKLGGIQKNMYLAGTSDGPDGDTVPNITTDRKTGIGAWSDDDYASLLSIGMLPDGDFVGGSMGEVIENTETLTNKDRKAIITYLMSVPAILNKVTKKPSQK